METYQIIGHNGRLINAKIKRYKSNTVFIVTWNEKDSLFTKLIDLQDLENCNK